MADKLFRVNEFSSGFEVEHIPTGKTHWMSDGVDVLFDENDKALSPGDPDFRQKWEDALNEDAMTTLEAYFPEEYVKQD